MYILPNTNIVQSLRSAARIVSVSVILISTVVIWGWVKDISVLKSIEPYWPTMKANICVGFILCASALLLRTSPGLSKGSRRLAFAFSLLAFALGMMTLFQDVFRLDVGFDQLLFAEPASTVATSSPGRMPPINSLSLALLGFAMFLPAIRDRYYLTQLCAVAVHLLSIWGLTGYYLYGSPLPIPSFGLSSLLSLILFLLLSIATLFSWPDQGWMSIVSSDTVGGGTARILLPAAIATPILLGLLRLGGHKVQLYSAELGVAFQIVSIIIFLVIVIWWNAKLQVRIDMHRKKQEIQLRESEARLRNVLELLPIGVSIINKEGQIVRENPSSRELWQSITGNAIRTYHDYGYHEARISSELSAGESFISRALMNGTTSIGNIIEVRTTDGTRKTLINSAVPIQSDTNEILGAIIVNEDITELRAAQQSLEKQAQILNLVYDAVIVRNVDSGIITYWNRGAQELYGWESSEAIGKVSLALLKTVFTERAENIENEFLSHGRWEGELIQRTKDGKALILLSRWTLERDRAGKPMSVLEINYDITARKHVEEALQRMNEELEMRVQERTARLARTNEALQEEIRDRQSIESALRKTKEMYSLLAENIPELVWMAQEDGYVEYCNRRWYEYTGTNPNVPLGRGWENVIHPTDMKPTIDTWAQAITKGIPYEFQCRLRRSDGAYRWHIIRAVPWHDSDGKILRWFGTCTDIDEQKLSENKIRQFSEELEQRVARRTEELTKVNRELEAFTYSVSHDLRAPVRHIDGFIKMLLEETAQSLEGRDKRHLEQISDASRLMSLMIDDLLAFSRLGKAQLATTIVQPGTIVADIIRSMEAETKGRKIQWTLKSLPQVKADPNLLKLVLTNLISNAIKYTAPKRTADLEIGSCPKKDLEEIIYVKDNGVGFDMAYVNRLFGVFQRLHPEDQFEGVGIGLANARRIIEKHGGKIWAESTIGEGATFYFSLPSAD